MCGIAGFFPGPLREGDAEANCAIRCMLDTLEHRGPDDMGVWMDTDAGIVLGHRRLSIIDLSAEGHQPMASACGRYVITFNGEIYNFREVRRKLDCEDGQHVWRGHSDTEVMLAAISKWGLAKALEEFNGMFGLALWDRRDRVLHLVRDRIGEKPLYYGYSGGIFMFASELKALRRHPGWSGEVDWGALTLYLRHGYISNVEIVPMLVEIR